MQDGDDPGKAPEGGGRHLHHAHWHHHGPDGQHDHDHGDGFSGGHAHDHLHVEASLGEFLSWLFGGEGGAGAEEENGPNPGAAGNGPVPSGDGGPAGEAAPKVRSTGNTKT